MTHKIVVGLGFGDESKGATVDWLCATNDIKAVVRYNGGPQAAHNVVTPDGRHHTFAQFGSGTFHGVPTFLSGHMLVNPFNLGLEADHLESLGIENPLDLVFIDHDALLVTPYHCAANKAREDIRGEGRHGSTGQGIGETMRYAIMHPDDAPRMIDLYRPEHLRRKLIRLYDQFNAEVPLPLDLPTIETLVADYTAIRDDLQIVDSTVLEDFLDSGDCVFEGAQGVLLDQLYGFHPHVTFSTTTQANARSLLGGREAEVYGLTRSYHTRHGAGPLPTENDRLDDFPEPHNGTGVYQGAWRVGGLDLSLLKYAIHVNGGIDHLVVSHADRLDRGVDVFAGYQHHESKMQAWLHGSETLSPPYTIEQSRNLGEKMKYVIPSHCETVYDADRLTTYLHSVLGIVPSVYSYGPTWEDRVVANFCSFC